MHRVFAELYMCMYIYVQIYKYIYISLEYVREHCLSQLPCSLDNIQWLVFLLVSQHQQAVRGISGTRSSRFLQGHAPCIMCNGNAKMFVKGIGKILKASRKLPF